MISLVFLTSLTLGQVNLQLHPQNDAWIATDKLEHVGMGAASGAFGFGFGAISGQKSNDRIISGLMLCSGVIVAWEVSSLMGRGGHASYKDVVAGGVGCGLTIVLLHFLTKPNP